MQNAASPTGFPLPKHGKMAMGEAIGSGRSCWEPLKTKDRISGRSSETNMQREETPKASALKGETGGKGYYKGGGDKRTMAVKSKVGWDCQYPVAGSNKNPTPWGKKMSFHCKSRWSSCGRNIVSRILRLRSLEPSKRTIQIIKGVVELTYREFFLLFFTW